MKRLLSTTAFLIVIVAIAAAAVYALNGASVAETAAAPAAMTGSASVQSEVLAPAATTKYNVIAMPLNSQQNFLDEGYTWDLAGLGDYVGAGVAQVLEWNPSTGTYLQYIPGLGGDNPALKVGGVYWVELDSSADTVVSFVGDVPDQGSVSFALVRPTSGCTYNDISLPLDQSAITTAQELADAVGNVEQVLAWNPTTNSFLQYIPGLGGDDIDMKIGYPYELCLQSGGATTWP